jgi:peptide/nickel transport system substrate-binding protein
VTLRLNVVVMKNSDFQKVTEKLTAQWKDLGVLASTTIVDPDDPAARVAQDVLQPRNYDVLIYQLATSADPDVYAYWHSSQATQTGANYSNYNNAISDGSLASARTRVEPDLRNAKYLVFAKQWLSDVPAIGLYQATTQYVSNRNIHTIGQSDQLVLPTDRYAGLLYWTVNNKTVFTTP